MDDGQNHSMICNDPLVLSRESLSVLSIRISNTIVVICKGYGSYLVGWSWPAAQSASSIPILPGPAAGLDVAPEH